MEEVGLSGELDRIAREVLERLHEGLQVIGFDWRYLFVNDAVAEQAKRKKHELVGRTMMECFPGIEHTPMFSALERCMAKRVYERMENEFAYPDGSKGWFELRLVPVTEGVCVLSLDITASVRSRLALEDAHRALHASAQAHRSLFEACPIPAFVIDIKTLNFLAVNDAMIALYGYSKDEFSNMKAWAIVDDGEVAMKARLARFGDQDVHGTIRHRNKRGDALEVEYTSRRFTYEGLEARFAVVRDVSERYEAEKTRALLAAIVASSNDAIIGKSLDGTIRAWNAAATHLFGFSAEEVIGQPIFVIVPDDLLDEERSLLARVSMGERIDQYETVRRRKDGTRLAVSISIAPIVDDSGRVVGASKTARDLTAQRSAAEALQRTEEQLRQSQKMEAIGRLAGGVAHDFNNDLTVILSSCAILEDDLPEDDPRLAELEQIRKAAVRSADLTRQLLLFSRTHVVEMKVLDLDEILTGAEKMLGRIVGEDIALVVKRAPNLGRIRADRSHVEQVLMNLVVNARDAMPVGGRLTIESVDVLLDEDYARSHLNTRTGRHVMLAVTDTGTGIDEATLPRIFEPFFTTKEPGKGTGLGLSTVFGIVQRCAGASGSTASRGEGRRSKSTFPRSRVRRQPGRRPRARR